MARSDFQPWFWPASWIAQRPPRSWPQSPGANLTPSTKSFRGPRTCRPSSGPTSSSRRCRDFCRVLRHRDWTASDARRGSRWQRPRRPPHRLRSSTDRASGDRPSTGGRSRPRNWPWPRHGPRRGRRRDRRYQHSIEGRSGRKAVLLHRHRRLLAGERRAGVRHHAVLSIAAVERVEKNGHYLGKRVQEELARQGPSYHHRALHPVLRARGHGSPLDSKRRHGRRPAAAPPAGRRGRCRSGSRRHRDRPTARPRARPRWARTPGSRRHDPPHTRHPRRIHPSQTQLAGRSIRHRDGRRRPVTEPNARIAPTTFDAWLAPVSRGGHG